MGAKPKRDPEEDDVTVVVEALRRLLRDKPTERALRRVARAAMGETPDEPSPAPAADQAG